MTQHDTTGATAADADRTTVYLGNRNTIVVADGGDRVPQPGKRCTTVLVRPDATLLEAVQEISGAGGVWSYHSDDKAPAWVAASGPLADGLIAMLTAQYPGIEVRDPQPDAGEGGDV